MHRSSAIDPTGEGQKPVISIILIRPQAPKLHKNFHHFKCSLCVTKKNI